MKAFIVMMVMVSSILAQEDPQYQVFPYNSSVGKDYYGTGLWDDPSFVLHQDGINNVSLSSGGGDPNGFYREFNFPLNSGDPQDLWFEKGETYTVRFARGASWNSITLWNPGEYDITVPPGPSSSWQDSIIVSSGLYTMHWRLANYDTLRIRLWAASVIDYAFAVLEIPGTQDLSPSTWASIKAAF